MTTRLPGARLVFTQGLQATLRTAFFASKPGSKHHRWVAGVRATGDCGDDDRAMVQIV